MNINLLLVKEDKSPKYPPRTYYNAKSSDVTLALAVDLTTRGEILTKNAAGDKYLGMEIAKECSPLELSRHLYKKLSKSDGKKLNIAGNGIYTLCKYGINQKDINQIVYQIVAQVHHYIEIERIYTGGQTGVDIAGAVAGYALEIPTEVTLPKGFIQRFEDNKDVEGSMESVVNQIQFGAMSLAKYKPI